MIACDLMLYKFFYLPYILTSLFLLNIITLSFVVLNIFFNLVFEFCLILVNKRMFISAKYIYISVVVVD